MDTFTRVNMISRDMNRQVSLAAQKPINARATQYYLKNISKIKSIDQFLNDDRIYQYAMTAFGLSSMIFAKGFMRKVLSEGVTDSNSFANKLTDPRYRALADVFDFKTFGSTATQDKKVGRPIVARYNRMVLELDEGEQNQGVRLALYFQRKASTIRSPMELLGDSPLTEVALTLARLPKTAMKGDLNNLAKTIERVIPMADLKDPKKVLKLIQRFSILWDMDNNQQRGVQSALGLIAPLHMGAGGAPVIGMSDQTMLGLQSLSLGARNI